MLIPKIYRINISQNLDFTMFLRLYSADIYELYAYNPEIYDPEQVYLLTKLIREKKKKFVLSVKDPELIKALSPDYIRVCNFWTFDDGKIDDILDYSYTSKVPSILEISRVGNNTFGAIPALLSLYDFPEFKMEIIASEFRWNYLNDNFSKIKEWGQTYKHLYIRNLPRCIGEDLGVPVTRDYFNFELNKFRACSVPSQFLSKDFSLSPKCLSCNLRDSCLGIFKEHKLLTVNPKQESQYESMCIYNL